MLYYEPFPAANIESTKVGVNIGASKGNGALLRKLLNDRSLREHDVPVVETTPR